MPTLRERLDDLATLIGHYLRDSVNPRLLPPGGTPGQVLAKASASNYQAAWQEPAGAAFFDMAQPQAIWQAAGASTTISAFGEGALTAIGTATASAAVAATNPYTATRLLEYLVTTAAPTAIAGFRLAAAKWFLSSIANRGGFRLQCRFGLGTGAANAANRCFVGLRPAGAPADANPSTLANIVGVGWDSTDANIQFLHNDASGAATKIDLGPAFPVPTVDRARVYDLRIWAEPGTLAVNYRLIDIDNPGQVATGAASTDLPGSGVMLAPVGYASAGGTSSVIGLALARLQIQG